MDDQSQPSPPPVRVGDLYIADYSPEGYHVVYPSGQYATLPAHSGDPSPDNAAADIAYALANPPAPVAPVVVLTPLTILGRLTPAEEAALSGSTDLAVSIVRNRLIAASEVRSDDPRTAEGAAILVSKGIITAKRAAEIFPL
jgi:hypothetical protein